MPKLLEYISQFDGPNKDVLNHLIVEPIRVLRFLSNFFFSKINKHFVRQ
jgi:hypothetical protein